MITQQEKDNILCGFENIQISIDRLSTMIGKYAEKKNEIMALLTKRFATQNTEQLLDALIKRKLDLISLKESFKTIPMIEDSIND